MAIKHTVGLAVAAALCVSLTGGAATATEACEVILTVYGQVSNANRGPIDAFDDVLMYRLGAEFDQAYAFCREDLVAMPQASLTADYGNFDNGPVTATGPTLATVLEAAGASASPNEVVLTAVDGYQYVVDGGTELSRILAAVQANGRVLDFGGRGPVWIFAEPGVINDGAGETDDGLVWALVMIEVE